MKYLTIAIVAVLWLNLHSIPLGTAPVRPVLPQHRLAFAMKLGKEALPTIALMNESLPPDTRVYGIWLEDHRVYADFQLVGSIYGYGTHLVLPDVPIATYMRSLDCEYVLYDEKRLSRSSPYFDGEQYEVPVENRLWDVYFEECVEMYPMRTRYDGEEVRMTPRVKLWRLK